MNSKLFKRLIATTLIFTLALISPMQSLRSNAAEKTVKYVKEFKLFIKEKGTQADAEEWCNSQSEGDWHVVEGDLNAGADGAFSKKVGVFLCYCTTEDENEAVRDIAVMNEKGNYSESNYKMLLEKQKEEYRDLVRDLKTQVKGYQEGLKKEVKTAVMARDLLNGYKEDDSGKLLGDLLAELDLDQEKDENQLTDILLQANGEVVLYVQQQLSLASESESRTWLDRMEQLGGYDKFYKRIKNAFNGDDNLAKSGMEKKYKEKALVIADSWDELTKRFNEIKEFENKDGVGSMSKEQLTEWRTKILATADGLDYVRKRAFADNLAMYKYEGKTLLDFFMQDKSEISGDNLYKLYPMVSSLRPGQIAGIDSTVSLYSLINQAFSSTLMNDYDKGKLAEVEKAVGTDQSKELEEGKKLVEKSIDQQTKGKAKSIYAGVDREVFKGGVAVTSDTLDFSNSSETKWITALSDAFVENNDRIQMINVGGFVAGLLSTVALNIAYNSIMEDAVEDVMNNFLYHGKNYGFSYETGDFLKNQTSSRIYSYLEGIAKDEADEEAREIAQQAFNEVTKAARGENTSAKILYGLTKGLTIALIIVEVANVILNVVALYNYYNRDHLPIPHHIVDMTTNKDKETSYVAYKSVRDNSGNPGDLNGSASKQWLALYQTYDKRVGSPIVAPESGYELNVYYGKDRSKSDFTTPLHIFGQPNTPQNLTYADGEKGWSYNDRKGGTYLYFTHYDEKALPNEEEKTVEKTEEEIATAEPVSGESADVDTPADENDQTGTTTLTGTIAVIGGGVAVVLFIVIFVVYRSRKKTHGEE